MDYNILEEGIEKVKNNANNIQTEIKNREIIINAEDIQGNHLYLPVLYDPGWKCVINGKKIDTINIFGGFIGIPVTSKDMLIKLVFVPEGTTLGIVTSLFISLAALAISKMRKVHKTIIEISCLLCVKFVLLLFFVLVYVIPIVRLLLHIMLRI